jgi:hypothetical protein
LLAQNHELSPLEKVADPVAIKGKPEGATVKDLNALGAKRAAAAGR